MPRGHVYKYRGQVADTRDSRARLLQSRGLTKAEARQFQKLPLNDPGLVAILHSRQRIRSRVVKKAEERDWSEGKRAREYYKAVRGQYRRAHAVVKGGVNAGKPSPWELRRIALRSVGEPTSPEKYNKGYPKRNKGDHARQHRLRNQALRLESEVARASEGKVDNAMLAGWIHTLNGNIARATDKGRRLELQKGRDRLQKMLREQGG